MAIIERPKRHAAGCVAFESLDSLGPLLRVYMPGL
jgi:hypothetical protein